MPYWWPITLLHVCSVTIGLIAGFLAMSFPKGSGLHRVSGNFFFGAMLCGAGTGAFLATFVHLNRGNILGSVLTLYTVATAWVAGRRRERTVSLFDGAALLAVLLLGTTAFSWGVTAANSAKGRLDGYGPGLFFVFGTIILLFAASDVRTIVRGGVAGAQRIARHLWRMGLALLLTLGSAYPGQARLFPVAWRETNLLYVPHILVFGAMAFWLVRTLRRRMATVPA
jgi:uncharacterized membrane protein